MANLRRDRTFTERAIKGANAVSAGDRKQITDAREAEMPPLKLTIDLLGGLSFQGQQSFLASLQRQNTTLTALQAETATAMDKPLADRRDGLAKDYVAITNEVIDTLDKLGTELAAAVKLKDPFVDEMMTAKQLGCHHRRRDDDSQAAWLDRTQLGRRYLRRVVEWPRLWASPA
jgi:hypothetical protein